MSETYPIDNAAGQSALAYRTTEQAASFARMVSRLHSYTIASGPNRGAQPLAALTTRDLRDPAVALLDACAVVFDILSFYQERLANEAFLRTATEDVSVLQLTRMLGYQPAPALAASTYLAFTIESAPGMPASVAIPAGTQVKSVPSQGQTPQSFEIATALTASASCNQLVPQSTRPQTVIASSDPAQGDTTLSLRFSGVATRLLVGDLCCIAGVTTARVTQVSPSIKSGYTDVQLAIVSGPPVRLQTPPAAQDLPVGNATQLPLLLNHTDTTSTLLGHSYTDADLSAAIAQRAWSAAEVQAQVQAALQAQRVPQPVYAYRQRVACFGSGAPSWASLPKPNAVYIRGTDAYSTATSSWDDADGNNLRTVWLDSWGQLYSGGSAGYDLILERSVSGVLPGSTLLLVGPGGVKQYTVTAVGEVAIRGYGTAARVTGISVSAPPATAQQAAADGFLTRATTVYLQSEQLALVNQVPLLSDPPISTTLTLSSLVLGLVPGQPLLVTGQPVDSPGTAQTEVAFLLQATHSGGYTTLYFSPPLSRQYLQSTVTVCANVAAATNGETVANEILGSGDSAQGNQRFALKRGPLTYLPAVSASGAQSTLQVRVNDVLWREVPSLLSLDATGSGYVIVRDQSGQASVLFGDGVHGARLPSGTNNVVATYRIGSGPSGQVGSGSLRLLQGRLLGLRSVTNPLAARGGAAAEATAATRLSAPLTARSLGRAVSLSDYEALAGAFPEIAKAQASAILLHGLPTVHLTVATADGSPLDPSSTLYQSLYQTLLALGNPTQPLIVDDYQPLYFQIKARLSIDPSRSAANVLAAVAAALGREFAFAQRSFAQPVYSSEVLLVMQRVPGVLGAILDALYLASGPSGQNPLLTAAEARVDTQGMSHGAQLLQLVLGSADLESLS